ncbi:MAG: precorrin-2 C(20)-methyltransferase [Alphaproteobacteria bacterium]
MSGTAYGIGVGPGDPELMTLKGVRLLGACPVIAFPAPDEGDSLARAIAAPHIPAGRTEIAIRVPMTTARYPAHAVYDAAAAEIANHLAGGRDVAILCEGDPFFYGSFMYLFDRLSERAPVQVVPGVSSLTACAAALATPLAARSDVLSVIPATLDAETLERRLDACDSAAIIKIGQHLPKVRRALEATGRAAMARYIERATLPGERILPLDTMTDSKAPYFSMVLTHRRGSATS